MFYSKNQMEYILTISHMADVALLANKLTKETLFETNLFSKQGSLSLEEVKELAQSIQGKTKRVFVWDSLQSDKQIQAKLPIVKALLPYFDAIRFADIGISKVLEENEIHIEKQLSLLHTTPSAHAVLSWLLALKDKPTVVAISNQIPLDEIKLLSQLLIENNLSCAIELLGAGKLEVYYSSRSLLDRQDKDAFLVQEIASEDRPLQKNKIQQKQAGTLMYYDKDLYILDLATEIEQYYITRLAISFPQEKERQAFINLHTNINWQTELKQYWTTPTFRGFLRANRTDKPLSRLKNQFLDQYREQAFATLIDAHKPNYCVIELLRPVTLPISGYMITPEGKRWDFNFTSLVNLKEEIFTDQVPQGIYKVGWLKYSFPTSLLCFNED